MVFRNLKGTTNNSFQLGKNNPVSMRNNSGIAEFQHNSSSWYPFIRNYGNLTSNPTGTIVDGSVYYNTDMQMWMNYDTSRSKWLSFETAEFQQGRNGTTNAGVYYRAINGMTLSASRGYPAFYNGTVVYFAYTRNDTDSATFAVMRSGTSFYTLNSTARIDRKTDVDADFSQNDILAVMNQAGGNGTSYVQCWVGIKWRDT